MIATGQYTISKIYDGSKGEQGLSVSKVSTQYYLSTSPTSLTGGSWVDTQPKVTTGKYLWERNKTTLSDNSVVYSDAYYAQTISGLVSDVDNVKGQITDKVWQSDITTSINSYDSSTVSTIRDRVTTTEQDISGITTRVSDVESTTGSLGTRLTSAESSITQNAENIELKVAKDGVISAINQSAESITISADKVNIAGSTSFTSLSNQVTAIQNEADKNAELIRGTQESGTYSWTGTSLTISQLTDGTEIRYWLPYSVGGSQVSKGYSYYDGSKTTTGTNSGVVLTLTLKDGTTTEEIPVYYGSMTRLTSHYGYGNIIRMIYRENVRVNNSNTTYYTVEKGFWCDGNYDTNSAYTQYSNGVLVGANSIFQYSLLMKDTANTWVSIVTSGGTGTSKGAYTGGLIYDKITFHSSSSTYTTGKTSGNVYDSISFDFRYSTNCGTTLTNRRPVYLVGTINQNNGLFYLDQTQWWTQTVPTTADGKTYIYVGEAYSNYQVWLATDNKAYQYYDGKFITLEEIRDAESRKWINTTGQNAADIIANWATDATSSTTTINGGLIQTHTIESTHLATDAIMSNNFQASQNVNSPYSVAGSFLDLTNGNFYTPNFGLDNVNGNAYFNGEITATSGQIGDDTSNHWQIGTVVDFNGNQSAAIESNGTSYIQSGDWMISNNRIDTRHYDNQRKYTYLYEDGTYWDFGLHTPSLTSNNEYENNFIYIRNHESTIPTLEGAWNYVFRVDRNGMIYINGVSLDDKYASIDGVSGAYLPMTGGSLTGNLSVGGNLTVTGTVSGLKNLSINGKTYNGSSAVTVGTIGAAYGGTGQTSLINSANALINALDTGSSTPVDNDYYISQYVNGGTTTKTYHRRPMSALWLYIKGKINADTDLYTDKFVPKTGGEFTGAVTVSDALIADEITSGNLIVNGVGRFTNGIYGDLTGNASTATVAAKVADSGNGQATTFAYSKSSLNTTAYFAAWDGYELRAINPSNTLATIGAVNKTGDTMTGRLIVPTIKVDSIVNEDTGYTHRIDFGRSSFNQMNFYEYGGVYNFYKNTVKANKDNAILLGKITTNGWEGNVVGNVTGNATTATKATQDGNGNTISSTYLKLSGGTLTKADGVSYTVANGEAIRANPTSIIQSPIPKYLWHDVLAFCKIGIPNYYTTSDGTTWTASTLEKNIFANMENWGEKDVLGSNVNGSRWEWIDVGLYASQISWLVLGITYASPIAHFDVLIETSEDRGSTWTTLSSSTNLYYSLTPIWIKVNGLCQNSIRITITRNSDSSDNYRLPICSMKLLTSRWGNQGKGSELEHPYTWDGDGNITAKGTFTGTFNGNATSATSATTATKLNSTRSFTIGKTAKNVDWSGAVSFSQAEISDNASTSAAGWMSKDDKTKLNGIEANAQVNTITGVKGNSETTYRTGDVNITASNIGLGNLTNNKQVKGLSSGTTSGHLVTWGSDGYTVADSGIAKGSVTTKITLSGSDYSASSNTITITKANLQSAVQDTSLVLMTAAERSKLSSIQVSEGGTIDFSGVTASAPITATVNETTKAVNITHNTSGVTQGTYRSVTVNTYGHVTAGTNPTTLSGYGITDAKIASGVITLGSNTITPLTASSTLDATKLSGTASISTTGNANTATEFSSNASVTLTGDTTGTASSKKGWSVTTKTDRLSTVGDNRSVGTTPNDYKNKIIFQGLKSNGYIGSPAGSTNYYSYLVGLRGWADSSGGKAHELAFNDNGIFTRMGSTTTWDSWRKLLDSENYTDYTVTKTGTGASGTWGIGISGNATTATKFSSNRSIALTGDVTGSASSNGENGWSISTTVGDDSHNHTTQTIVPRITKSYTGVIASANNDANCHMYYFKVVPDSYAGQWSIKYRVYATINGVSTGNGSGFEESVVYISGMRNTYSTYRTWNNISNTSYRPYYYHTFYRAKEAGISYGHLLGVSLRYAYNPTTTTNTRNVTFEILDYEGCTPTFFDSPIVYANASGTGSTNYEGLTTFDATTQGLTTAGDRNDVNWQNRENYSSRTTKNALYRYQVCLTNSTGQLIPINSVNNSVATDKVLTTDAFDPFGEIFYWASTNTYNAGGNVGNSSLYRQQLVDLRYSFNCGGYGTTPTLTARLPLYLVASPQTDGTAKLHSSPLSQTLPISDDGLIYIYLGMVYEDTKPYRVVLSLHHPVYWYKNGAVRQYIQRAETANTANSATTATNATNLLAYSVNEVTIGANYATSGSSTNNKVYINYRDVHGGSTSNNATAITDYYFYNRKGSVDGVSIHAGTFDGNLTGTATKATQDGSGNTITSYYVTLSTTQTISGAKTFSSAVTFANGTWNLMGDDAYIGDCNAAGRIGIKGKNGATGVRFVPYSGSTNNDITIDGTGNLTATGNLIQQGTVTVGSHAKLIYNENLECLEFSFV